MAAPASASSCAILCSSSFARGKRSLSVLSTTIMMALQVRTYGSASLVGSRLQCIGLRLTVLCYSIAPTTDAGQFDHRHPTAVCLGSDAGSFRHWIQPEQTRDCQCHHDASQRTAVRLAVGAVDITSFIVILYRRVVCTWTALSSSSRCYRASASRTLPALSKPRMQTFISSLPKMRCHSAENAMPIFRACAA